LGNFLSTSDTNVNLILQWYIHLRAETHMAEQTCFH